MMANLTENEIVLEAKRVFDIEIKALEKTRDSLDKVFVEILDEVVGCQGKVIITGMGKPSHVASKIAATMASLGTPSFFLDPAEAMHGDLGMVDDKDVVIAISYSGESDEIVRILPNIKILGAKVIGISANPSSTLVKYSDISQILPDFDEACYLGLAPTSSTTVEMCYGDALAVATSRIYGYKDVDFGVRHPAGSLGKKLLFRVADLMVTGEENAVIMSHQSLKEAAIELGKKRLGIVSIVDADKHLLGVITDGDLRKQFANEANIYALSVNDIMTKHPIVISPYRMAVEALKMMNDKNITYMPVLDNGKLVGTIRMKDITNKGIVG